MSIRIAVSRDVVYLHHCKRLLYWAGGCYPLGGIDRAVHPVFQEEDGPEAEVLSGLAVRRCPALNCMLVLTALVVPASLFFSQMRRPGSSVLPEDP